ncbi:MAG: exonuclease domain-containing protein [Candidatus Aenigmatarchaeota archaeon]
MLVTDVETTGIDPEKYSIVSLGSIRYEDPQDTFYEECRIRDGAEVSDRALAINGFTREEITDPKKPEPGEVLNDFIRWAGSAEDRTISGENPSFDTGFLQKTAERNDIDWPFGYRTVDLHSLTYAHQISRRLKPPTKDRKSALSLNKTLEYVGIPEDVRSEEHDALEDAKLEAEAIARLIEGKNLVEEYEAYSVPLYLK